MDWSRIDWVKVCETWLWVLINLALPLFIIPIAAMHYWLKKLRLIALSQVALYVVCGPD
jgi:hypothetical protein